MLRVDALQIGDAVILSNGKSVTVTALQSLQSRNGAGRVATATLNRGAFEENVPARAVSAPADGVLHIGTAKLKAGQLVNAATVTADSMDAANMFLVELSGPGEISIDGVNFVISWPDIESATATDAEVLVVRQSILNRALVSGWHYVQDNRIQLAVNGAIVVSESASGSRLKFVLEQPAQIFQIYSRSAIVWQQHPSSTDRRSLGVQILNVQADGEDIALDSRGFVAGFHYVETSHGRQYRWTDGSASLQLPFAASVLEIDVGDSLSALERIWTLEHKLGTSKNPWQIPV